MLLRNAILALGATAALCTAVGCAPAHPVVEREEVYDYDGYHRTVIVEEDPPPVVVVGPPVYVGARWGYGPGYRRWR